MVMKTLEDCNKFNIFLKEENVIFIKKMFFIFQNSRNELV